MTAVTARAAAAAPRATPGLRLEPNMGRRSAWLPTDCTTPGKGTQVLYPNEVTMTAFCRAAAGVTGKMPGRHMAPRTPSPIPGPDFSPEPRAWARVSAPRTGKANGEAEAGRRADRPLPPKGLTRGSPFVPARKTQRLEVILTRGGGGPRQHHDSPATVLLQRPRPESRPARHACAHSHWLPWV